MTGYQLFLALMVFMAFWAFCVFARDRFFGVATSAFTLTVFFASLLAYAACYHI